MYVCDRGRETVVVSADALRDKLRDGMELQKLSSWGLAQKRIVTVESTEAGERLFWQKVGQTSARRDAESCIKVRGHPLPVCVCVRACTCVCA